MISYAGRQPLVYRELPFLHTFIESTLDNRLHTCSCVKSSGAMHSDNQSQTRRWQSQLGVLIVC